MKSQIAMFFSILIASGCLASAAGCAIAPVEPDTEKPSQTESAATSPESQSAPESVKADTESKAAPQVGSCPPPRDWCTCDSGNGLGRQTFCTTDALCFRICGGRT